MWWTIGILVALICIIVLFLRAKLHITFLFVHHDDRDFIRIKGKFLTFIRFKKEIPLLELDKSDFSIKTREKTEAGHQSKEDKKSYNPSEIWNGIRRFNDFVKDVIGLHTIIRRFIRKIHVDSLTWDSHIGAGDASATGFLTGVAWGVKGSIVGTIANATTMHASPSLTLVPHYQMKISKTRFQCMFSFRIGQAIYALLQIARNMQHIRPNLKKKTAQVGG
ncbi:hypothetical protein N781_09840 [Pontibacillus halophilus JSM 076056 = DSM 19796]|uniref:DUF2953 domain-containing protein n=1 Tax=Pontibacillus halophilus JSM 076056 = DSM 19796 TaxID=1385510 RepID=A0A0A5GNS1_9BACI|nr:DUF2953 domain-containing protein [Pontibacillus halophilus]KGX93609.1 hypothetical protein N781_09840 [Pontibacillus halophilus JSM 076056 = DSM 19796]